MRSNSIFSVFWLTSSIRSLDGAEHPLELYDVGPNTELNQNLDLLMSSTSFRNTNKKVTKNFQFKFSVETHIQIDVGVECDFHVVLRIKGLAIAFPVVSQSADGASQTSSVGVGPEFGSRGEEQSQNGSQSGNIGQQRSAAGDDSVRVQLCPDLMWGTTKPIRFSSIEKIIKNR